MPQLLFGGLLAIIMLGFYIWSIVDAVSIAQCKANCREFSTNMSYMLNALGGLISATVIGVLGATRAGEFPAQKSFEKNLSGTVKTVAAYMPSVFILVWIVCGVIMVIFGFILYDTVAPLSAQAKVWLGSAIGSVYAYLGVNPDHQ